MAYSFKDTGDAIIKYLITLCLSGQKLLNYFRKKLLKGLCHTYFFHSVEIDQISLSSINLQLNLIYSCFMFSGWWQGTTCTSKHQDRVLKGTRPVFCLHFSMCRQSGAPRAPAESHTASPSTITWRANTLVSGGEMISHKTHTCHLIPYKSIRSGIVESMLTLNAIGVFLSRSDICAWPLCVELVRYNAVDCTCVLARGMWGVVQDVRNVLSVCFCLCLSVSAFVCVWRWLKGALVVWLMARARYNQSFDRVVCCNMSCHTARIHTYWSKHTCAHIQAQTLEYKHTQRHGFPFIKTKLEIKCWYKYMIKRET